MSAPLTPEQRETLEELVLSMIAALNYEQINYGGRFTTVTVDGSDPRRRRAARRRPRRGEGATEARRTLPS